MKRILSVLLALVMLAMLSGTFALSASAAYNTDGFAAEVVRLVNIERANEGLGPLQFGNKALNDAAMKRAQEYAADPSLRHNRPGGKSFSTVLAEYSVSWNACGENIAEGQTTPASVVTGWMNSSGHKQNIMGGKDNEGNPLNFNWIGVAICEGLDGRLYWVQLFVKSGSLAANGDTDPGGTVITNPGNDPGANPGNGKEYFQLWGKTTSWEKSPFNWILMVVCFGWIWMAF